MMGMLAGLLGLRTAWAGLLAHLLLAVLLGAGFSALVRYQPGSYAGTLSGGLLYGLLWWIVGPLTVLPILLDATLRWNAEVAAGLMVSLIGHLLDGAGRGVPTFLLEARYNPEWILRSPAKAVRGTRRTEQLRTSAAALFWSLVVVIALTLPIVPEM